MFAAVGPRGMVQEVGALLVEYNANGKPPHHVHDAGIAHILLRRERFRVNTQQNRVFPIDRDLPIAIRAIGVDLEVDSERADGLGGVRFSGLAAPA